MPRHSDHRVRKTWETHTRAEKISVLRSIGDAYRAGLLNKVAKLHCSCDSKFLAYAHVPGSFTAFVAHRAMVWEFETAVRKVNPFFTVPMWDFMVMEDKHDPEGFMELTGGRTTSCVTYDGPLFDIPAREPKICANITGRAAYRDFKFREQWLPREYALANAEAMFSSLVHNTPVKALLHGLFGSDGTSHRNVGGCMKSSFASDTTIEGCREKPCLEGDAILFLNHAMIDYLIEFSTTLHPTDWRHMLWHRVVHEHRTKSEPTPPIYARLVDEPETPIPDLSVTLKQMIYHHNVTYIHPPWRATTRNASYPEYLNYLKNTLATEGLNRIPGLGNINGDQANVSAVSWKKLVEANAASRQHTTAFFPCQNSLMGRGGCNL